MGQVRPGGPGAHSGMTSLRCTARSTAAPARRRTGAHHHRHHLPPPEGLARRPLDVGGGHRLDPPAPLLEPLGRGEHLARAVPAGQVGHRVERERQRHPVPLLHADELLLRARAPRPALPSTRSTSSMHPGQLARRAGPVDDGHPGVREGVDAGVERVGQPASLHHLEGQARGEPVVQQAADAEVDGVVRGGARAGRGTRGRTPSARRRGPPPRAGGRRARRGRPGHAEACPRGSAPRYRSARSATSRWSTGPATASTRFAPL